MKELTKEEFDSITASMIVEAADSLKEPFSDDFDSHRMKGKIEGLNTLRGLFGLSTVSTWLDLADVLDENDEDDDWTNPFQTII